MQVIDAMTTIYASKESRLCLRSAETQTQWAQGLVMALWESSELPQTNLLKFCQVWGCYAWEPGLPSLTTGTCSVAANIHFPFSPRHPLQSAVLTPPPHPTQIAVCGFNYLFWFSPWKFPSTVFASVSPRKKLLNRGESYFSHLDRPQTDKNIGKYFIP